MGFLDRWPLRATRADDRARAAFAAVPRSADLPTSAQAAYANPDVDPVMFGTVGLTSPVGGVSSAPITSRQAVMVPAMKRARDLIAGTLGTIPLDQLDQLRKPITPSWLDQPEPDVPRSVTMTRTVWDLAFNRHAWWRITRFDYRGYPSQVRRLDPLSVNVTEKGEVFYSRDGKRQGTSWEYVPDDELIRFDSLTEPLRVVAARIVRVALALEDAAFLYATEPYPAGYFKPSNGLDPVDDDDVPPGTPPISEDDDATDGGRSRVIEATLGQWGDARRRRATGYVPSWLDYVPVQFNPEQLQLPAARDYAVTEIARETGIDPDQLAVNTTSRTYWNAQQKRQDFLDLVLAHYMVPIEDRLSMTDVTPRTTSIAFRRVAFLRQDDLTRYQAYSAGLACGALTPAEVREAEGRPPIEQTDSTDTGGDTVQPTDQTITQAELAPAASNVHQLQRAAFADPNRPVVMIAPSTASRATFAVDTVKRTITGLALPYGVVASLGWDRYTFSDGSIAIPDDPSRIKLWVEHQSGTAVGYCTELTSDESGLTASFKVVTGPEGDKALAYADPDNGRVWDGLSVGFNPDTRFTGPDDDGVYTATAASLMEISLTAAPAFDDARVSSVAASAARASSNHQEGRTMTENQTTAGGTGTAVADPPSTQAGTPAPGTTTTVTTDTDRAAFSTEIATAVKAGMSEVLTQLATQGQRGPSPSNAGVTATQIREASPYGPLDGSDTAGEFSLLDDIKQQFSGNADAVKRLRTFVTEQHAAFAATPVKSTDVGAWNPPQQRPDLYRDDPLLTVRRPLWDAISTGGITNKTPFVVPTFDSGNVSVGPHTEGVEPDPENTVKAGSFNVVPTAMSGKAEITREVWDQGGNPVTDAIIFRRMVAAYQRGIERSIATMLDALGLAGDHIVALPSVADVELSKAVQAVLTELGYEEGGDRFSLFATNKELGTSLANATDTTGRPLFPAINPVNANGTNSADLVGVRVGNKAAAGAWSLNASSYLVDPASLWAWASAPTELRFEYQIKSIDIGIWGYAASACISKDDVMRLTYTAPDED